MNHKERCKIWYQENREHKLRYQKDYNQKTNYQNEKSEKERKLRYIKRRTRFLFPLEGKKCKFCSLKAEEHHHTTNPITVEDFVFICHDCHIELHPDKPKCKEE